MSAIVKPFQILSDLAQKSVAQAAGLPQQDEAVELWSGIGFSIGQVHYVAEMGSVSEILHLPKITAVPGVKNWMRGVANVRGRLLPIMDLTRFFGLPQSTAKTRDKRVLVVEYDDALSGVIVDAVLGMQYFSADSLKPTETSGVPKAMRNFVAGSYQKSGVDWNVFNASALTEDDNFKDVALS